MRMTGQVDALDQLHGDVGQPADLTRVQDADDVRMLQPPRHFGLAQKAGARIGEVVARELLGQRHGLERNLLVGGWIVPQVDGAHGATPDLLDQHILAELTHGDLGHGPRRHRAPGVDRGSLRETAGAHQAQFDLAPFRVDVGHVFVYIPGTVVALLALEGHGNALQGIERHLALGRLRQKTVQRVPGSVHRPVTQARERLADTLPSGIVSR